jgi:hypothetical protein
MARAQWFATRCSLLAQQAAVLIMEEMKGLPTVSEPSQDLRQGSALTRKKSVKNSSWERITTPCDQATRPTR